MYTKILWQTGILCLFYWSGVQISEKLHIPIPGSVIGMALLFICLCVGLIKLQHIEIAVNNMLKHMLFFFIPIVVTLLTSGDLINKNGAALLALVIVSAVAAISTTGLIIQKFGVGRKYVRTEVRMAIQLSGKNSAPTRIFTEDISGGGVKVITKQHIDVGTELTCIITSTKMGIIIATGEVVRTEKKGTDFRLGIKFTKMNKQDHKKLIDFTCRMGEYAVEDTPEPKLKLVPRYIEKQDT